MLREWIRNISFALLRQIIVDDRVRGNTLWRLAVEEFERRGQVERLSRHRTTGTYPSAI